MPSAEQLEQYSQIADAKLGVAEDFSWPVAVLAGLCVYQQWDNWLITVVAAAGVFFIATIKFKREAARAEEVYYRAAKLGKYYSAPERET